MTNLISQLKYKDTMTGGMTDVTETAEPVVDIWPYVEMLSNDGVVSDYVRENLLVEKVYRSKVGNYDHVLLPTGKDNYFIVLIINIKEKVILGHHLLDLNILYK